MLSSSQTDNNNTDIYLQLDDLNTNDTHLLHGKSYDIFSPMADISFSIYLNYHFTYGTSLRLFKPQNLTIMFQCLRYLHCCADQEKAVRFFNANFSKLDAFNLKEAHHWINNQVSKAELDKRKFVYYNDQSCQELMTQLWLCQFTQNPPILKALLATTDKRIVANLKSSEFEGIDLEGGQPNVLGVLLMKIRAQLKNELAQYKQITVRKTLDEPLVSSLSFVHVPREQISNKNISAEELNNIDPCFTIVEYKKRGLQSINVAFDFFSVFKELKTDDNKCVIKTSEFSKLDKAKKTTSNLQQTGLFAPIKNHLAESDSDELTPLLAKDPGKRYGTM